MISIMKKLLLAIMISSGAVLSLFAQLNLIPMPRDMKVSEGECRTSVAPKAEIVANTSTVHL